MPYGPDFFQFSDSGKLDSSPLATGFTKPSTEVNDQTWEFAEPAGFINAIVEGSVRSRPLIESQSDEIKTTIIDSVIAGTEERFAKDGIYKAPMPALIGSAVKGQA